jgi:hypothetical protein
VRHISIAHDADLTVNWQLDPRLQAGAVVVYVASDIAYSASANEGGMNDETVKQLQGMAEKLIGVQNQIDALRAQQLPLMQDMALILSGMEGEIKPTITVYSQRDPAWSMVKLGTSAVTIGSHGCLITCAASMLTDAGKLFTPALLNAWLILNGGYAGDNLFVFAAIDKLNAVKFEYMVECATKPAPMAQLEQEIAAGKFVIVKVDFNPATIATEEHWVRYLGDGQMFDPWQGDIAPIVPRYRGANAAQAILKCLVYRKV